MHCRYLLFLRERENKRCHNLIQKVFHLKSSYEQHENAHKNHKYSILLIVYFTPPHPGIADFPQSIMIAFLCGKR